MNMDMYVYRVTEKQDSESGGEPGEPFEAFNLSEAKRISTRAAGHTLSQPKVQAGNGRTRKKRRRPTKGVPGPQGSYFDLHLRGAGRHMIPALTERLRPLVGAGQSPYKER